MRVARGAYGIIEARRSGVKPVEPVVVSFVGRVAGVANPQVRVEPGADEWGFLADLEVILFVRRETVLNHHLLPIAREAAELSVWDVELRQGMDVWPVFFGASVPEVHCADHEGRREGRFKRWQRVPWSVRANREFMA